MGSSCCTICRNLRRSYAHRVAQAEARIFRNEINVELWTVEGLAWKEKSRYMHKFSLQFYISKRESLERTFKRAQVFYMTVDGFVQAASGVSPSSVYVASFDYIFVNVDEAHQLVYEQLAPVAARSQKINICMDQGQHIAYDRQSNHMRVCAEVDSNVYYPWPRAVFGGSSLPSWHSLQEKNVHTLKYSRRFGRIMCEFLRETSAEYCDETTGIWSQVEPCADGMFTDAEKAGVPETYLRFVMYKGEFFPL